MPLSRIVIFLGLIFWPLNLFLNNTLSDFLNYVFPIFQPKLLLFPVILFALNKKWKLLLFSIILFLLFFNRFWGQTIFKNDYEAQQLVIRQTQLYPNVLLARLFHNKARIYWDKYNDNFFALVDPNNYFFGFAPRQITTNNQNLKKFPSFALIPMLFGFYYLGKHTLKKFLIVFLISCVLSLSVLNIFDRHDIILWIPLSLIFIHGVKRLQKSYPKFSKYFFVLFIIFGIFELWQILL